MKYRNIYIGELIKQRFEKENISISQFARAIHCSRANVYNIFRAKSIDIDKLILISDVLNYNFLEEYISKEPQTINTQIVLDIELKDGRFNVKQVLE